MSGNLDPAAAPFEEKTEREASTDADALARLVRLVANLDEAAAQLQHVRTPDDIAEQIGTALRGLGIESHIALLDTPVEVSGEDSSIAGTLRVVYLSIAGAVLRIVDRLIGRSLIGMEIPLERVRIFAEVIRQKRTAYVPSPKTTIHEMMPWVPEQALSEFGHLIPVRRVIVAPLLSRGHALGILSVWADDLRPEDSAVIGAFARQAGVALDNARQTQEAELRAHRLTLLNEIGRDVSRSLDVERVLERVAARATEAMGAAASTVWLRADTGTQKIAQLVAQHGFEEMATRLPPTCGATRDTSNAPVLRAITRRAPQIIGDLRTAAGSMPPRARGILVREGYRSLVAAPLLTPTDEAIGAVVVYTHQPNSFTRDTADYLEAIGRHCAVAVAHARLYAEAQSARERAEQTAHQLGAQAAELDTIIEAMPEGILVSDAEGQAVRINKNALAMLGVTDEQARRPAEALRALLNLRHLDGTPVALENTPRMRALRGHTYTDYRFTLQRSDSGEDIQVRMASAPIRDADSSIIGAVVIITDVSALHRLERQKDEFLSVASHELKTPLTSLKILTQVTQRRLKRAGAPEVAQFDLMERGIHRMERLITDLLDVTRIDAGQLALRRDSCDLSAICREAVDEQMTASGRDISIELPDEPVQVWADVDRLSQVITNLLSNALKYSAISTPVTLRLTCTDDEARVTVRDEGAGIPEDMLPHLFERFYRVPGVQVQSGSGVGLGLGLHISKTIVERHGGQIGVQSAAGEGATFWFTLPLVY